MRSFVKIILPLLFILLLFLPEAVYSYCIEWVWDRDPVYSDCSCGVNDICSGDEICVFGWDRKVHCAPACGKLGKGGGWWNSSVCPSARDCGIWSVEGQTAYYACYPYDGGGGGGSGGGGGGDNPSCDNITTNVASTELWPVIPESQRPIGYSEDRTTTTIVISSNKITPPEGCTVNFSVGPVKNSGGHIEDNNAHTGTRQRGTISTITLPGGSQGTASVTYRSSEVSGEERITAELVDSGQIGAFNVNIKVPWLEPLSGEYFSLKCDIEPANCSNYKHTDFYNVQSWVNSMFNEIAYEYQEKFPNDEMLVVTDASLARGGLYDYKNTWDTPHTYHRIGTDIDVRSKNIPKDNRDEFKQIVCDNYGFPKLESPGKDNEHYHLYFLPYNPDIVENCVKDAPEGDGGGGDIPT